MKIKRCQIENFTVFEKQEIEFCDGINVVIGANGTGKSHLLKILYAIIQTIPGNKEAERNNTDILRFYEELNGVFKPEDYDVNNMIRSKDRKEPTVFHLESDLGHHYAELRRDYHIGAAKVVLGGTVSRDLQQPQIENTSGLFIPPNEVLAIYPGFTASYEMRELAFDQTYYDICKALSAAPLKSMPDILSYVKNYLEMNILKGHVVQKGDRFYVQNPDGSDPLEAHLLAEGHRKIAALIHLLKNGSIDKGTVLFWDEPEANLNPRLIKHMSLLQKSLISPDFNSSFVLCVKLFRDFW